jgi:hypothetical protein
MRSDFVLTTDSLAMRAALENGVVVDSSGGNLNGLTEKQLKALCKRHKWTLTEVGGKNERGPAHRFVRWARRRRP